MRALWQKIHKKPILTTQPALPKWAGMKRDGWTGLSLDVDILAFAGLLGDFCPQQ